MVAAMAGFAIEDASMKALTAHLPPGEVGILLGLGGGLFFWAALRMRGERLFVRAALQGPALVRNLTEMGAAMTMIMSVALVPLSVVASILQAMPLMVTLGAALFLGESVGWRRWSAIGVGFLGVLLILRPGMTGFDSRALLPLLAVVFLTARDLVTKRLPAGISSFQVSGWGFLASIPGGFLLLVLQRAQPVPPDAGQWGLLALAISAGIAAYIALVLSTRSSDIGATTPFRYSRLVFAMLLGVIVFGERPDAMTLAGAALIVAAGLYTLLREIGLMRARLR